MAGRPLALPRFGLPLLMALATQAAFAAALPPETPKPAQKSEESHWVFSLLPKSLQKNPPLELTVVTEMTEAGKKLPPPSPARPVYFEAYSPGPRHMGDSEGAGKTVAKEEIERVLTRSLATNGFLPRSLPEHPPELLIIYTWGAHSLLVEGDPENPSLSPEKIAANLLDRAALVGGEKFARELLDLFQQADAMSTAASATVAPSGQPVFTPEMMAFANPVNLFRMRDPKNDFLIDQTASDVFYVSASAYDYRSVTQNKRILLWRTRMTVGAAGVSQQQSLPTLLISAAPFFGKETTEPQILTRRTLREGSVELGTPTVVEENVKLPSPVPKK